MSDCELDEKVSSWCKECGGLCCSKPFIFLSEREVERLGSQAEKLQCVVVGGKEIQVIGGEERGCPFWSDKGCDLEEEVRPLECKLYPMVIFLKEGKLGVGFSKACPRYLDFKKEAGWIKHQEKLLQEEARKLWSKQEFLAHLALAERWRKGLNPDFE